MRESRYIKWKEESLALTIDYPEYLKPGEKYPLIIICHGFIGSRIGVDRLFVKAAEELIKENFIVLRFDYTGCGESTGDYGNTGLHDLVSQTKTVIDFAVTLDQIDKNDLTLLGHSLGGATSVITSESDKRINKLILWSSVARPYEDIRKIVGYDKVRSLNNFSSTVDFSGYLLRKSFFDALKPFNPLESAAKFTGDVLILHGTADEEIPVKYADLYEHTFKNGYSYSCQKYVIDNANHTISNNSHFKELIFHTRKWLKSKVAKDNLTTFAL
jgi:pimeloyl-ACP methyl ester carboxylesterase